MSKLVLEHVESFDRTVIISDNNYAKNFFLNTLDELKTMNYGTIGMENPMLPIRCFKTERSAGNFNIVDVMRFNVSKDGFLIIAYHDQYDGISYGIVDEVSGLYFNEIFPNIYKDDYARINSVYSAADFLTKNHPKYYNAIVKLRSLTNRYAEKTEVPFSDLIIDAGIYYAARESIQSKHSCDVIVTSSTAQKIPNVTVAMSNVHDEKTCDVELVIKSAEQNLRFEYVRNTWNLKGFAIPISHETLTNIIISRFQVSENPGHLYLADFVYNEDIKLYDLATSKPDYLLSDAVNSWLSALEDTFRD